MACFFRPCLLSILWLWSLADGPSGIIPANEERWEKVRGVGGMETGYDVTGLTIKLLVLHETNEAGGLFQNEADLFWLKF